MVRVASGKGQMQQAIADPVVARIASTWAKAARVQIEGAWTGVELVDVAVALGEAMREANPTTASSAMVGVGGALVALSAQRATRGALVSDLPSPHTQFLAGFAKAAKLAIHVHVMLPGRGADAELAAVTALGQAWPLPAGSIVREPASKLSRTKLIAMSKAISSGPAERRDLPEVSGARRRSAEIRKGSKKAAPGATAEFPPLPPLDKKRRAT